MSESRSDDAWEEDEGEEPSSPPFWKRGRWLLLGLGVVLLVIFLFTRGKSQHAQDAQKGEQTSIGVVVPYQPPAPSRPPMLHRPPRS